MAARFTPTIHSGEKAFRDFLNYYNSLESDNKNPLMQVGPLILWVLENGKLPGMFTQSDGIGIFMLWNNYILLLGENLEPEKSTKEKAAGFGKELVLGVAEEMLKDATWGLSGLLITSVQGIRKQIGSKKEVDPWELLGSQRSRYIPIKDVIRVENAETNILKKCIRLVVKDEGNKETHYLIAPFVAEGVDKESARKLGSLIQKIMTP